jgi:hypothetical protein
MFEFLNKIDSDNAWKIKAKKRRLENKNLKKEIGRVKDSRKKWRQKAEDYKEKIIMLEKELKKN